MAWVRYRIEEIQANERYALNGGPFGSKLVSQMYVDDGVPVIRGANLPFGERFSFEGLVFVTEDKADELYANTARPGDVVITQRGTLGQVGLIPTDSVYERFVISQSQMKLTVNREIADAEFVYYFFRMPDTVERICSHESSSGVPHINLQTLREFEIELPPLPIQRRIAAILSAYDDLIEVNTRRIKALEEIARRTYEEWFIHYRHPGGNGAKPEGWETGTLDDVVVLQRGFDLPKRDRTDGPYPIISASGVSGSHSEWKVKAPGLVTGRSGTLGEVILAWDDFWPLNTTLWAKSLPTGSLFFAYYTLLQIDLVGFNAGAAVPTLNRNDISGLAIEIPDKETLDRFEQIVKSYQFFAKRLFDQNTNLRTQRDLLLPRLVSGAIDVSEVESILEVAAE